jgi:hypothetical protein
MDAFSGFGEKSKPKTFTFTVIGQYAKSSLIALCSPKTKFKNRHSEEDGMNHNAVFPL